MDFSARLKYLRKDAKMTQQELGAKIGVKVPSISKYESGSSIPPYNKVVALAELFDVSTDYLLGLSDDPGREKEEPIEGAYIYIMGANGKREKIVIPPDKVDRVKKLLETAFPEMMEE